MGGLAGVRVVSRLVTVIVLVASGAYLFIYLYRWEWNRALMAGVFFVAAEVALVAAGFATRLRAIERRLDARASDVGPPGEGPDEVGERRPPGRRGPFAWLEEAGGGFGVFIPILLGAGVILSLVAWIVERLARYVTAPMVDHGHVSFLTSLELPTGGLVPEAGASEDTGGPPPLAPPPGPTGTRRALHAATVLGTIALLLSGVWFLREAAESRPDAGRSGTTTLQLEVRTRETGSTTAQIVDALWIACRLRLPADAVLVASDVVAPGEAELVVSPALGRTDHRQFVGCLQDAVLDRVRADVTGWETDPSAEP
jgi:hypothetical protein